MVEVLLFLLIILFILFSNEINSAVFLLTLLPFHAFLKNILDLFFNGGNLFSYWKEIAILILLVKIIVSRRKIILPKGLFIFISCFLFYVFLFLFFADQLFLAISPLRNHFFSLFLFVVFYNLDIDIKAFKRIVFFSTMSFFISYLMGFVQLFFLKIPLGFLMGRIDYIDPNGHVFYTTTSARILGYERMAGIIGGPNGFGVFVALSLLLIFIIRFTKIRQIFSERSSGLFLLLTFAIGVFALIYSFSRAGWVVFAIGVTIFVYYLKLKRFVLYIGLAMFFLLPIFLVISGGSVVENVMRKTFSGEEASSADRLNNFVYGLNEVFISPFGHGLGTTNNQYPESIDFFAESATINIIYEIGIFGYLFLLVIFILLGTKSYFMRIKYALPLLSFAVLFSTFFISLVSVNTYGMPYILLSWVYIGLGINPFLNQCLEKYSVK